MPIPSDRIAASLAKGLASTYLVAGEEPLLIHEAVEAIRAAAAAGGVDERETLHVDASFKWELLAQAAGSLSLFASRRLFEVDMPNGKPGRDGSAALKAWASNPPDGDILLLRCGELDSSSRRSAWFKALDASGVAVYDYTPRGRELAGWIRRRLKQAGLSATEDAVALMADRVEGNLMACAQDIDKLSLLRPGAEVDVDAIREAISDSARFDVFDLPDRALSGDARSALRTLDRLREEGVEPPLVLWSLARDLRLLYRSSIAVGRGASAPAALQKSGVWKTRHGAWVKALDRLRPAQIRRLLAQAAFTDRVIKGVENGREWEELVKLVAMLAGANAGAMAFN